MSNTVIRPADQLQTLDVIGDAITPLLTSADGTGYELFDLRGPADSGPPPHAHPWTEAYYVLEGRVSVTVNGAEHIVDAGDVVNVPADVLHSYCILSTEARFIVITSPHGAANFFADVDANVGPMPDGLGTLIEVAQRNRLTSPLFDR